MILACELGFSSLSTLTRWRRRSEGRLWRKTRLAPGEFYWTDDNDGYAFVITRLSKSAKRAKPT